MPLSKNQSLSQKIGIIKTNFLLISEECGVGWYQKLLILAVYGEPKIQNDFNGYQSTDLNIHTHRIKVRV